MKRLAIVVFCLAFAGPALAVEPPDWEEAVRCAATLTVVSQAADADPAKAPRRAFFIRKLRDTANLMGSQSSRDALQTTREFNVLVGEQTATRKERAARFAREATQCESRAEELYGAQYRPS